MHASLERLSEPAIDSRWLSEGCRIMQNWSKGVELELHGVGRYRVVKSTEDAARCLLEYWPRGKGKAYMDAQQACLDALEGSTTPEVAREAFIGAALAARIHIRSMG